MIRYPEFIAKGWQIGSGPTEATCKTLTERLKGPGMRWDGETPRRSWGSNRFHRVTNGRSTGEVICPQRVRDARKFCHTRCP